MRFGDDLNDALVETTIGLNSKCIEFGILGFMWVGYVQFFDEVCMEELCYALRR